MPPLELHVDVRPERVGPVPEPDELVVVHGQPQRERHECGQEQEERDEEGVVVHGTHVGDEAGQLERRATKIVSSPPANGLRSNQP